MLYSRTSFYKLLANFIIVGVGGLLFIAIRGASVLENTVVFGFVLYLDAIFSQDRYCIIGNIKDETDVISIE